MQDVIVIGGGPGGATSSALLAERGFRVLLLEREQFPRFQIGESLLPYNNDLFRKLGIWESLREAEGRGKCLPKYGSEFMTGDGEVRFTFRFDQNLSGDYRRSFQVKRESFDKLLLDRASELGVDVRQRMAVSDVDLSDPRKAVVTARDHEGNSVTLESRFVIDASGHGTVVGSKYGGKVEDPSLRKVSFFAHYRNVEPSAPDDNSGNTVIVVLQNAWFWMIPIDCETTSVGLVVDRDHYTGCGLNPEQLLDATIAGTPYVAARMGGAERVSQIYARKDFSYRMKRVVGPNFALVGDAAGFMDPIFSTGVFMAMKSGAVAADGVEQLLRSGNMKPLKAYESSLHLALSRYFSFISNFYRKEFLEVFLRPQNRFGLLRIVVGVLAGDVFERRHERWKVALFFFLVRIQRYRAVIAPRISWDRLPAAARA